MIKALLVNLLGEDCQLVPGIPLKLRNIKYFAKIMILELCLIRKKKLGIL